MYVLILENMTYMGSHGNDQKNKSLMLHTIRYTLRLTFHLDPSIRDFTSNPD